MRLPDWRERLANVRPRPFAYGQHDCALAAAELVEAITGIDYAARFKPYDARKAVRLLREYGGMAGIVDSLLGPHRPPNEAREGDVMLIPQGKREAIGVRVGYRILCASGVTVYLDRASACWRVE